VCAAGRAVATATVALAQLAGRPGLGQLMAVALIDAGLCSVATVAERGLIGEVVPDALYSDAVAVNEGRAAAAFTAGPPLGGALFGFSRRFRSWPTGCRSSRRSPRSSSCDGRFRVRVRGQWHRGAPRSVTAWLGRSLMRGRA